ncbi:hypothetical protein ACSZND_02985 [Aeromonas hydrophila]
MAKPTREDFIAAARARYSTQQQAPTDVKEQGIFGDAVDMFQRGLGQTLGGDLETVGQLTGSQGVKDAGRGVSAWADGQLQEASTPMREAMGKQFFQENTETGAIEAGDAWADPRAWAGNFSTVLGQFVGLVGGTKGAGVLAKPALRGAGKLLAKDLVEGQARELVAKATVKDAISAGALDSVRSAYLAAPGEAAKRAVLDKAIGRLTSIGYGAHAGAMASGMRAQQAEQEARGYFNALGNDELNANPIYQQAYWELADGEMQGASIGDIRRAAIDSVAERAATDAWSDPRALTADFLSGMLTGAGGGVGGLLGKVGTTRAGAAVRGFAGEGATEAWQGGETQRAVNQAVQEWADETRDPMAGVLSAALNEGTLGGAFGGVVGAVHGPQAPDIAKPVARVERRVVTGDEQMDDMIHGLDQRQAERGASISSEIDSMFAGASNPLGSGKFDPIRDIPAYERQGFVRGAHDFKGTEIPGALEGELLAPETGLMPLSGSTDLIPQGGSAAQDLEDLAGGRMPPSGRPAVTDQRLDGDLMPQELESERAGLTGATIEGDGREVGAELPYRDFIVGEDGRQAQRRAADIQRRGRELADQPAQIGQSDTIFVPGEPGADPRNSAYTPPRLSRDQVDSTLGEESIRDPRSPVAQSIEQAGSATDSVFGPLKSLRITRKGKPFATEKEAAMASRKDQEMPVPLNGGGFGVAAIGEVQQAQAQQGAVKQPSSNSAQQDRQDGKTEIAQNGMVIVHGSGNPGMSEQDIQIVRASGQKQGKKGRVYGGFYGTSEQDAHQAQAYADMMGGTPTLYDVKIKPGTKVLHKQGDITRLSESYINELVSQGYGVVTGTDPRGQTEHVVIDKSAVASMAPRGAQATPSQVNDTNVADIRQPSDQPAASVSAETVPAPSATAGEASQLAPAIDTGYREVIPVKQPKTEVSNEPVTPVPAISSEGQGDQLGTGEPAAAGAEPAIAGLTDRAGAGDRADLLASPPVPDGQQQNDQALTAPATDAGVVVSEVMQPEPAVQEPAAAPTPWAEAIDNPDGTITLKGEMPLIKQWAKDSGVKAILGKGGMVVAKSSAAKVRGYVSPAASEPAQQIEAARAEVAPDPTEAQKEAGNYKKGHLTLQGMDIALENPKGSTRSGTDQDGKAWQSTMAHDYGYIKRTLGADGDHVDVFIGDRPDSETVYVVDQVDPKTGKFDEHKVMMGFASEPAARDGYLANYEKGWKGLSAIKAMPVEEFKRWVKEGDTTKPIADAAPAQEEGRGNAQDDKPVKVPERSISFSKQAMAQGDKPAKALTRKEAELVTKGWFKQYRGASGIDVQIHATQAELETALGLAAKDGLIRRAAFDDDTGTLHVAADTIANPKRMREILRHEVLAHYGLANVLGDGEYTKLISRLIKSKKDPSMKPVWDWVSTHYADEDIGVQAEEVVAHLAELEMGSWGRGWDRVVAWVTRALRAVGFVPDGITAAETRTLIEGLGKKMRRADGGVVTAEGDRLWFSAERSPWGKDFPEVILHGRLADATGHPDYAAAKGGDDAAARRLVSDVLSPDAIRQLKKVIGNREAIALGVHAEEAVSRNAIPQAMADVLGKVLGIEVSVDIVQAAKVGRTAQDGFGRLANQPSFDGAVRTDKPYLIMDDTLTQGGTLANLKGYIENRGGEVLAATALTGKQYSAKIAIDSSTLEQLRDQYDGTGLEAWWHNRFGYGFDSLTESEGRYLLRAKDADKVRDRVTAAGYAAPARGEHESARDDGSLPPDGLKFSQSNTAADDALQKLNLGPKPDIIDKTKTNLDKLRKVERSVVKSWLDRFIKKANTEVLDALAPIKYAEDAAGITDAADSGYVAARMATGAASTMQATMLYGLPEWKDGVIQKKAGTGEKDALLGIFSDLGADLHNWLGWMAGHRAELLMEQGRENC